MATDPTFTATAKVGIGQLTTANTNRDGTGTIVTVFTAGASGSRINEVVIQATGTTTLGSVSLFIHDGSNSRLFDEIAIAAATPSATVQATRVVKRYDELVIPTGYSLRAAPTKSETFNVIAEGGDF